MKVGGQDVRATWGEKRVRCLRYVKKMSDLSGARIHITGVVQGVGFRPFVYGLAQRLQLTGWVRNTSAGVDIEADGRAEALHAFMQALQEELPPLARIEEMAVSYQPANGFTRFEIVHSQAVAGGFQPVATDTAVCADCLRELFDPHDRRYRYPFINCTNCGPRFTIIQGMPYDRPQTTMSPFAMCPTCAAEYGNPLDRRFHAQPIACPVCGPQVWLEVSGQWRVVSEGEGAVQEARARLQAGQIVAVKGLGGFHLACDATQAAAVAELRRRKRRQEKPLAVMVGDAAAAARQCVLDEAAKALLTGRERPIVLLRRQADGTIADNVAPRQHDLGVMLPYTPLHYLLLEAAPGFPEALVMTSGNLSEEPIASDNEEARQRLAGLADAFLLHDRQIEARCDDSVVRVMPASPPTLPRHMPIRRARGYAPAPRRLPWGVPPLLATGGELKNAFCLTRDQYAFLSHHIGDMENYETLQAFERAVGHYERLFQIKPQLVAHDLHPDYLATRYALARAEAERMPAIGVQHHHAHIAAVMAEHGLRGDRPVIGVAFDGTGYGTDGAVWGGEFLIADYGGYERAAHLAYVPLPGGEKAIREPWRMALSWLAQAGIPWQADLPPVQYALAQEQSERALAALRQQLASGLNAPPTSSMGRLFDAAAALVGVRQVVSYEAQAAIELEALVDPAVEDLYPFAWVGETVDMGPALAQMVKEWGAGVPASTLSARFHNAIAAMTAAVCRRLRQRYQAREAALSGGVWQNATLLQRTVRELEKDGFVVYIHETTPTNDGGLALGQAAVAAWRQGTN